MAAVFNKTLALNKGATFREHWEWKTGTPAVLVNLTGCTARMHVRPSTEATTLYHTLTTENDGLTLGNALGTVTLFISATATAKFQWTNAVYDLEIQFTDDTVIRFAEGNVTVTKEVTK